MSLLDIERNAVKSVISINPTQVTMTRPAVLANARGVNTVDFDNSSSVVITNPIRVVSKAKPYAQTAEEGGSYSSTKVYWIIADYETTILKYDRFTWFNKTFEVLDVEPITVGEGVKNYQAELKEFTQGTV